MTDHDASDEFTYCTKASAVVDVARGIYYAAKILKLLREAPVPPE